MGTESGLRRRVSGLSEAEFWQRFGTEEACRAALFQLRWGKGWACPGCGHGGYAELKGRAVYQCNRCKRQVGLTAGTVFHWTKLPLTTWFLAIYHLSQSKGGKRGRGAAGKTPFVAAVETTPERKPRRLRLTVGKGFRKKEIEELAKRDFAAGSNVVTDGLSCWTAVEQAGCSHFPMITGSGPQAAKWVPFTWVNTALGNIKTALAGTYHHVSAKHAQRYLASYAWRFNRRFQLDTLTERLAYACARTAPHPYRVIIEG